MDKIDSGDTAWVLMSAALVLFMTPGLALFYGGMVRAKNVLNMMMMSCIAMGTISVVWVLWGYSETFGESQGGLVGNPLQHFGLEGVMTAVYGTIPGSAFAAFQGVFAIIAVALISGAIADRTSDYWRPPFYLFEAHGLRPWLVNTKDVKHLPGRPKTDLARFGWLCKVAERQMLRPSFVPPHDIRRLRDLTRYRADLVGVRTAEKYRVEKLLEDACIKLSVLASDIFGVSGRAMLAAMIAGERDPRRLAQMARTRMRVKIGLLQEAFAGLTITTFNDHHRFLLTTMLARVDRADADIAALDDQIEQHLAPFADAVARLDQIPGIGPAAAAVIIAEIGLDMTRFPTPGRLASWAKFAPGVKSSAGKTKGNGSTGKGNRYLARVLGEAAAGAGRTDTFLGARYRRLARRRGKKKAVVAVGRSILIIIWHLLSDPEARFEDLGADHYDRHVSSAAKKRNHIRGLEALGYHVTLEPAA